MTWLYKFRGAPTRTAIADYECPVHGRFEREVARDENGDPPATRICGAMIFHGERDAVVCIRDAEYRISAPLCRVKRFEFIRGKSEKPEHKTWLDTTNLGEGQSLEEFREDRAKIREEQRVAEMVELRKRGDL